MFKTRVVSWLVGVSCACVVASGQLALAPVAASPVEATSDFAAVSASFFAAAERTAAAAVAGFELVSHSDTVDGSGRLARTSVKVRTSFDRPSRLTVRFLVDGHERFSHTQGSFEYAPAPGTYQAFVKVKPTSSFDRRQLAKVAPSAKYSVGSAPVFPYWSPYSSYGFTSEQIRETLEQNQSVPWGLSSLIALCGVPQDFAAVSCSGTTELVDGARVWSFDVSRSTPTPSRTLFTVYADAEGLLHKLTADGVAPVYSYSAQVRFSAVGAALPKLSGGRSVASPVLTREVALAGARSWARVVKRDLLSKLRERGLAVTVRNVHRVAGDAAIELSVPYSAWLSGAMWEPNRGGLRFRLAASDSISVSSARADVRVVDGVLKVAASSTLQYPSVP